jgi:hypothetical protein
MNVPISGSPARSPAIVAVTESGVTVRVQSRLGVETWRQVRDAREIARVRRIPLKVDLAGCPDASIGGLGALFLIKERLGSLSVWGCSERLAAGFDGLGICEICENCDACTVARANGKGMPRQ